MDYLHLFPQLIFLAQNVHLLILSKDLRICRAFLALWGKLFFSIIFWKALNYLFCLKVYYQLYSFDIFESTHNPFYWGHYGFLYQLFFSYLQKIKIFFAHSYPLTFIIKAKNFQNFF